MERGGSNGGFMSDIRNQVGGLRDQAPPQPTAEFRVGRVLGASFELLFQDFIKFFVIALIPAAPNALVALSTYFHVVPFASTRGFTIALGMLFIASGILVLFLYPISQAATLYGAFQDMRGQPFEFGPAFGRAFARFFPLLGLVIAWGLAVGFGTMLLIVPGLMLLAAFYVALPACVVERLGPLQSLSRSAALTKGHRWKVFGVYLVVFVVGVIGGGVFNVLAKLVAGFVVATLISLVWNAVFAAYNSVAITVMYHDLRVVKEGIDIDRIAAVFD
jgi:hypothetical protein